MEKKHWDFIDNFSTAKSPQQMLGVLAKTYYAQKAGIDPAKLVVISIMPCTAKKYELSRTEEMFASGFKDVDICLTTRELARMLSSRASTSWPSRTVRPTRSSANTPGPARSSAPPAA